MVKRGCHSGERWGVVHETSVAVLQITVPGKPKIKVSAIDTRWMGEMETLVEESGHWRRVGC